QLAAKTPPEQSLTSSSRNSQKFLALSNTHRSVSRDGAPCLDNGQLSTSWRKMISHSATTNSGSRRAAFLGAPFVRTRRVAGSVTQTAATSPLTDREITVASSGSEN